VSVVSAIRLMREVAITMRDGVRTTAEVWLPDDGEPHPALLVRTPYLKERIAATAAVDSRAANDRGYAVVLQDVRGRGSSEGNFEPFVTEQDDGFDTIAWVADQRWCDGRVVMSGISYVGATQWLAAASRPPALAGIAPALSSDEFGEGWSFTAGVPELGFLTSWSASELVPLAQRMLDDPARSWEDVTAATAVAPWLRAWLESPPGSDYWRRRSVADRRAQIEIPSLTIGGWYDIFLAGTLRSFDRSRDRRDRLIIGPWCHDEMMSHLIGIANVGVAGLGLASVFGWILDFYDAVLADSDPDLPRVRAYALGAKCWVDLDSWPPPGAETIGLGLESGSFAVSHGNPVPSLGGRGLLVNTPGWGNGILDQRPLLQRDDVHGAVHFRLAEDTLLAGPMRVRLNAAVASDPGDRLWCATLCVERPDGALHNLAEGVARAAPGGDAVEIELGHTLSLLERGTTLVLLLAGSSYPRWPKPAGDGVRSVGSGSELIMTVAPALAVELELASRRPPVADRAEREVRRS
jgi:uncharacterized protein